MGLACAAADEVPEPVARGTQGLIAIAFSAENEGDGILVCSAALAHWYSLDLGRAGPGRRIEGTLWYDRADGNLFLLNASQDRMPVQALWCGSPGQAWTTGTRVPLDRRIGEVPKPIRLACAPQGGNLACR
ncbi:MAG TPA: hypothetical protein VH414_03600 [Lichenihabitans sp.]|nr:hypothetical protein [Lichenihabitans sp.]